MMRVFFSGFVTPPGRKRHFAAGKEQLMPVNGKKLNRGWSLRDIILLGVLGVVFALVYMAVLNIGLIIQAAMTPFGYGVFAFEIVYGLWFLAASLAAYIIQKPGTALLAEFLAAAIEFLMLGNPGGPLVLVAGAFQGLGSEAGFAVFRYRVFNMKSLAVSALLAAVFSFSWEFVTMAYYLLDTKIVIARLCIRIVSAIVFSGFIAYGLGKGLAKTGVLKSYALGAEQAAPRIADD
jgi:energy-coupling factor transport system substrate-specific component